MVKDTINIKELISKGKKACRVGAFKSENKYDPKYFMGIVENIYKAEAIINEADEDKVKAYFKSRKCSNSWSNDNWGKRETLDGKMVDLVYELNQAGGVPMTAWNTDIRVRKIPNKVLDMYKDCLKYICLIMKHLGIKSYEKDKGKGGDYRHPDFGYAGGWEEAIEIAGIF